MAEDEILASYADAWQQPDVRLIRAAVVQCWAPEASYTDPVTDEAVGVDALVAVIEQFHEVFPGVRIAPTSPLDRHHRSGRFSWAMLQQDGSVMLDGVDFVDFAEDGKMTRVVGFFGPLAAQAGSLTGQPVAE